jgi:hypothetical protein
MTLQIHLVERFLHVVDMGGGHLYQAFAVPQQRTDGTNILVWPVGGPQQTHRV